MPVLTTDELNTLLLVETTPEEAARIKRRWEPIVRFLDALRYGDGDNYNGDVGCPHCNTNGYPYRCNTCRWRVVPKPQPLQCLRVSFGGITAGNLTAAKLLYLTSHSEGVAIRSYTNRAGIAAVRTLALGHIEWADAVIAKSGATAEHKERAT